MQSKVFGVNVLKWRSWKDRVWQGESVILKHITEVMVILIPRSGEDRGAVKEIRDQIPGRIILTDIGITSR